MENLQEWASILPYIISAASAIAAITPTKKDNLALFWIKRIVNVFALNIGAAKTADQGKADNWPKS